MLVLENNRTNATASFVRPPGDPARATDFALKRNSPAWKLGFQPKRRYAGMKYSG